jgi:hypothetical protein
MNPLPNDSSNYQIKLAFCNSSKQFVPASAIAITPGRGKGSKRDPFPPADPGEGESIPAGGIPNVTVNSFASYKGADDYLWRC